MIGYGMLYTVAVGAPIFLAALLATRLLRRQGRAERWVWLSALALAFVLPIVALAWSETPVEAPAAIVPIETGWIGLPEVVAVPAAPAVAVTMPDAEATIGIDPVLLGVWLLASALLGLRWVIAVVRLGRLTRRLPDETVEGVQVSLTEDLGPAVSGVMRPRILVPSWALSMPSDQLSLVLRHEEEHILAGDPWVIAATRVARVLAPWNPFVWLLSSHLLRAVELDCDRRVLRRYPDVEAYGQTLLTVSSLDPGFAYAAAGFAESEAPLRKRILAMTTPPKTVSILGILTTLVLGLVLIVGVFEIPVPTFRMEFGPEAAPAVPEAATAELGLTPAALNALTEDQEAVADRIAELEEEVRALQGAHVESMLRVELAERRIETYRALIALLGEEAEDEAAEEASLEATTGSMVGSDAVTTRLPASVVTFAKGTVTGLVLHDDTGAGVRGARISLRTAGIAGLSNNNGRFLLINVPVGEYEIEAELDGYRAGTATVEVTPGGTATVNVRLSPTTSPAGARAAVTTGTIMGTVIDEGTRDGLRSVQLSLLDTGIGGLSNVQGNYLLLGVPAGEYHLMAEYPGYQAVRQTVVVEPGETSRLTFRLNRIAVGVPGVGTEGQPVGAGFDMAAEGPEAPLLIIDNIIIDRHTETMTEALARHRAMGLEPGRIEVIKPPASIAVYGDDAAHGAIKVFMKRIGDDRPVLRAPESIDGRPIFMPHSLPPEVLNRDEVRRVRDAQYPADLRAQGVGGVVEVHVFVLESGEAQDVRIAVSSGNAELDEAALSVAAVFRFSPALNRDRPVAVWVQLPITFTPDEESGSR